MDIEALRALIIDGGGYKNVVRLIFDNNICISFNGSPDSKGLSESDFVLLGGTWFYKESAILRNNKTYEYDVKASIYHPLDCLQSVIMSNNMNDIDNIYTTDMIAQMTS